MNMSVLIRKVLFFLWFLVGLLIIVFSTHYVFKERDIRLTIIPGNFDAFSVKITRWLRDEVLLEKSFGDKFCSHVGQNITLHNPWYRMVAKQMNIKDGATVFINGIHCGEWIIALKDLFPQIKLYGVDQNPDSISYVKTIVNGSYSLSQPFQLDTSGISIKFDHAIVDDLLHDYKPDVQCKVVSQMIPLLKSGGSLFIGKTYETQTNNKSALVHNIRQNKGRKYLPKCYWSQDCLHTRPDVVEILYSKDSNYRNSTTNGLSGVRYVQGTSDHNKSTSDHAKGTSDFSASLSIFVYKHMLLTLDRKVVSNNLPESRYNRLQHRHKCTFSLLVDKNNNNNNNNNRRRLKRRVDKEVIKKAIKDIRLRGVEFHG